MNGLTGHPSTARQARSSGRTVKPYILVVKKLMNSYLVIWQASLYPDKTSRNVLSGITNHRPALTMTNLSLII